MLWWVSGAKLVQDSLRGTQGQLALVDDVNPPSPRGTSFPSILIQPLRWASIQVSIRSVRLGWIPISLFFFLFVLSEDFPP